MPPRKDLLTGLIAIKDEINSQIPLATNRFEEYECTESFSGLSEADIQQREELINKEFIAHEVMVKTARIQFYIHEHINAEFKKFIEDEKISSPQAMSQLQRERFKMNAIKEAFILSNKMKRSYQLLGRTYSVDLKGVEQYLTDNLDNLIERISTGELLTLKDKGLQERFTKDEILAEHRAIAHKQLMVNQPQQMLVAGNESDTTKKQQILQKAFVFSNGIYYDRIKTPVGYCEEHAVLGLIKMFKAFLVDENTRVEKVCITYLDEDNNPDDGHTFLVINRDMNSSLSDISSWGNDAILFDPWNKLVCYASDYPSLEKHYFSFPDGAEWESISFDHHDYSLLSNISEIDEYFSIAGNDQQEKREQLAKEEYRLTSLEKIEFKSCHELLYGILKKIKPNQFNYNLTIDITTGGHQPIRVLNGFKDPHIAIHRDFLGAISEGRIPIEQLEFGMLRSLYFIKEYPLANDASVTDADHSVIDQQAIEQFRHGPVAIDYLRYCIEFEKSHKEPHAFRIKMISSDSYSLKSVELNYQQRIKNIESLLAQNDSLRVNSKTFSTISNVIPELEHLSKTITYYSQVYQCNSVLEKINYLTSQLHTLLTELQPYELTRQPSVRLKEFCQCITNLGVDFQDAAQQGAVDDLLNEALSLRISGFELIYFSLLGVPDQEESHYNQLSLKPLGVFKKLQQLIDDFVSADNPETALRVATELLAVDQQLKTHFEHYNMCSSARMHLFEYKKNHNGQLPSGTDRFFGSTIGWHIQWRGFSESMSSLPWEPYLKWCQNDNTKAIAKTLWRLGVVNDNRLWPIFSYNELVQMMDYEGNKQYFPPLIELSGALALFGDDAYFQHTKAKYLEYSSLHHTLQNTMFDDPMISFEEAYTQFYDSNQPLLKLSRKDNINEDNSAVQFLLQQFLRVAIHGSNAEKQVVKSFFLGRKDNKDLRGLQGANSSLSYNTPYIKFFLEQSHQGVSFELFTLDDFIKLTNKVTGIHFYHYEIPPEQFIKIFKLGFERLTLPCVKQMIPLVNKMMSSSQIPRIIQSHLDQYGPYALFSDEATEICLFMNRHLSHPYHTKVRKELLGQLSLPNPFVISQLPDIDVSKGIILYRTLDMNLYFPSPEIQKEFGKWISQKIKLIENIDDKIRALEQVLFVGDKLLTMPLSDLPLRNELVKLWVESIVRKYGIDPLTSQYDETMKPIIAKVYENSAKRDTSYILNLLANAIESQQKLSDYMGLLLEPEKYLEQNKRQNKLISHGVTTLAALSSYLGKDRQDQLTLLNFLSAPLTPAALHDFASYLKNKGKEKKVAEIMGYNPGINDMEIHSVDHVSQLVYYQFWDRNLTERAVIINYLLLPPETVVSEQIQKQAYSDAYDYVAHQLFPLAMDPASDDHAAVAFLKAYLETADNYDRSYLLAGMLVTSSESQGENKGVGKKLALLCEHMGPAYVKLAQAIHSHPQTPGHLRKDLDHIKGRANPPTRWQLWRMIADTMPIKDRDNIARLKVLLGSASYNMALQVTLKDDKQAVLLLLREHAEKEAKAGFHHLSSAIKVCQHEKVSSLRGSMLGMIHEASELSATELSQACGDKQSDIAQCIYHLSMLIALKDNDYYQITMHPSKTLSSGNGYRFTELVRGTEFNDLPKTTEHEKDIRRLVAKAVVAAELTNILSGSFFDCDRHGNQLRVVVDEENHSVAIGLYDFGELALQEATPYELQQLKEVLIDFPKAVIKNSSFDAVFSQHIDAAIKLGKDTHYLMRIRKALLALHDFLQELSANDLLEAMQAVTRSSKLSLDLKQDFCRSVILIEGLQSLHQKTKQVATTVSAIKSGLSLFVTQATNKVKSVAQTLDFSPNMDDWF